MDSATIAAVSTPSGTAGVAVIRVSGPQAGSVCRTLAGRIPRPRHASLATLVDPAAGVPLDQALLLWFPAPASFTGEDVLEFQVHGGRAVVAAVLRSVLSIEGVRPAEPGEFTRRAFENNRMDLGEVEGLADLLEAETEAQRRQAFSLYSGRLTSEADRLHQALLPCLAMVEASIDFPEEGDVASDTLVMARRRLDAVVAEVRTLLADADRGERIRDGVTVVIAGPPNAGKSTLINALARRDVAIVSPVAGTTRDSIEVHLDLGGVPVVVVDTAGLRDSEDPVEMAGIGRSRARMEAADLVLWLSPDGAAGVPAERPPGAPAECWIIQTQADRGVAADPSARHRISAMTGEGMAVLLSALANFAAARVGGEPVVVVHERHRRIFRDVEAALDAAAATADWDSSAELVAEHLREALAALGRSRGRVGVEAMLDELFSAFCIGK